MFLVGLLLFVAVAYIVWVSAMVSNEWWRQRIDRAVAEALDDQPDALGSS